MPYDAESTELITQLRSELEKSRAEVDQVNGFRERLTAKHRTACDQLTNALEVIKNQNTVMEQLREELDKVTKEREASKYNSIIKHIEAICKDCGHTSTEDGCAYCIGQALANAESILSSTPPHSIK